jgi:antitoxin (DNA-binding transcriptional repressor) of toxin-antitoxin stability system
MIKVNIAEVKARLSEFLDAVEAGEQVIICKRNRPVAELHRIAAAHVGPRPVGGAKDLFSVPAAFFDPLPDEFVEAFYPEAAPVATRPSQVAERGPDDVHTRRGARAPRGRRR